MTTHAPDKAAREAFDPAEIERLIVAVDEWIKWGSPPLDVSRISDALRTLAGYQAAHDAAIESLLLKLQAAQQREATLVTLAEEAERGGRICRELGLGHDVQRASVWEHVAATIRAALATQPTSKGETT